MQWILIICLHFYPGLYPSKTRLELQKHLASLDNHEQALVFENTMVCCLFCITHLKHQYGKLSIYFEVAATRNNSF